jgi:hypothetical protein
MTKGPLKNRPCGKPCSVKYCIRHLALMDAVPYNPYIAREHDVSFEDGAARDSRGVIFRDLHPDTRVALPKENLGDRTE